MTDGRYKLYLIYAYKKKGNSEMVEKCFREDWTSVSPMIKLILYVLKEDYQSSIMQLKNVGNSPAEMEQRMYADSILFSELVKQENFSDEYFNIYKENFYYYRTPLE